MKCVTIKVLVSVICIVILSNQITHATIIDGTDSSFTFLTDTDTGLDWLDPITTVNMSYNDVQTQISGGSLVGWEYASSAQLNLLITNTGLILGDPITDQEYTEFDAMMTDWGGPTLYYDGGTEVTKAIRGITGDLYVGSYSADEIEWVKDTPPPATYRSSTYMPGQAGVGRYSRNDEYGSYLIRQTPQQPGAQYQSPPPLPFSASA